RSSSRRRRPGSSRWARTTWARRSSPARPSAAAASISASPAARRGGGRRRCIAWARVSSPMPAIREVHADGWRVRLDLAGQVLRLEVSEYEQPQAPLLPALPFAENGPVSAATLLLKAKQFDDGLHAAVEVA